MTLQEIISEAMKSIHTPKVDGRTKAGRAEKRLRQQRFDALNKAMAEFSVAQPALDLPRIYFSKISDPNVW